MKLLGPLADIGSQFLDQGAAEHPRAVPAVDSGTDQLALHRSLVSRGFRDPEYPGCLGEGHKVGDVAVAGLACHVGEAIHLVDIRQLTAAGARTDDLHDYLT